MVLPVLYSFRRCPYAMRARMALLYAGINCQVREVALKDKPSAMLQVSPKGTVPVLILEDGQVIDESLDIMLWALHQKDPENWRGTAEEMKISLEWIKQNDDQFKTHLDAYKYPQRLQNSNDVDRVHQARDKAFTFLIKLNEKIGGQDYILGAQRRLADVALFPFVRQFSMVDSTWFDQTPIPWVHRWLNRFLKDELFLKVMQKYPLWTPAQTDVYTLQS